MGVFNKILSWFSPVNAETPNFNEVSDKTYFERNHVEYVFNGSTRINRQHKDVIDGLIKIKYNIHMLESSSRTGFSETFDSESLKHIGNGYFL